MLHCGAISMSCLSLDAAREFVRPKTPSPARPCKRACKTPSPTRHNSTRSLPRKLPSPTGCYEGFHIRQRRSSATIRRHVGPHILHRCKVVQLEIEAAETCQWLRAAGFPQYAQMFEESAFPIDIASVEKDHDFLDQDLLESVSRRLRILNKCASMKIETPLHRAADDSDEEDQCAISNNWKYQRSCRRWSRRLPSDDLSHDGTEPHSQESSPTLTHTTVRLHSSSRESITTTDNEGYTSTSSFDSPAVVHKKYGRRPATTDVGEIIESNNRTSESVIPKMETKPRKAIIEISSPVLVKKTTGTDINFSNGSRDRMKGAKNLLKRLDSFKGKRGNSFRRKNKQEKEPVTISGPIVTDDSRIQQQIELFNCVDILRPELNENTNPDAVIMTPPPMRKRSNTGEKKDFSKRMGRVFSEPNSPVTHRKEFDYEFEFLKELEDYHLNLVADKLSFSDLDNNNEEKKSNDNLLERRTMGNRSPEVIGMRLHGLCRGSCGSTGTCSCSCSSDSCQDSRGGGGWKSTDELLSPSSTDVPMTPNDVFDNMPRALHSSFEHLLSSDTEFAESEFMRQIQNLKNIGHQGTSTPTDNTTPTNRTPTHRHSDNANLASSTPKTPKKLTHREFESEKKDILININRLLQSEKLEVPEADFEDFEVFPVQRKRTRSNSLPDTRPLKYRDTCMSESGLDDPELDAEVTDLSAELEQLLNGINESIHEMTENYRRVESVSTSTSSQVSSPICSHTSSPFPSPLPSPLPSPNLAHGKHGETDLGISVLSHDTSEHDDTAESNEDNSPAMQNRHQWRERRDSGVGNSLTRPNSGRRPRIRWHSFQKSHRPSLNSRPFQINSLSVSQLMILRKLSLLKLTAMMERHSASHRSGWSWMMPRFMKRNKTPDFKDRTVFGVPLLQNLQRTGHPLPQTIMYAMRYLRRTAHDAVGIFRKPGVRSRIQQLKKMNEANPDNISYEGMMAYDVADMLKQYFRELPEPLLTTKMSETFITIFTTLPKDMKLPAVQAAIMLLPDENREVLQSLLLFLSDIASHSDENQMTAYNLAVCFAPSLFQLGANSAPIKTGIHGIGSPRRQRKMQIGKPDQKELIENVAANEALALMIKEVKKLFMVPEELMSKCHFSYMDLGEPVTLEELGQKPDTEGGDYRKYMESCIQGVLKESRERFKGWVACPNIDQVEVAYKKVGDGHPLRLWKCSVEMDAPPADILHRVLKERHLWDEDLLKWRVVEKLGNQCDVMHYVFNTMAPHPNREYCVLRSWRTDLPKGTCVLVSTSIEHPEGSPIGGIRGTILASRFLIEPAGSGRSRLTHISRDRH
ncbi:rho GTPase-activating protein 7-like [Amphiura filiformis]|uniref:rho GTPase-activating protein 7-like n=1 Tax=Amphiura filiformis TaxID=82378 RepID=UPI003B2201E2